MSEREQAIALLPETAAQLNRDVRQMGVIMAQMGQMLAAMQRRMDEMEERQAAVTVSHGDVKRLQARIRYRAGELCRKYGLEDAESAKAFRAAMRKDLLKRFQVRDLHDIPAASLPAAEKAAAGWTDIRLAMERRGKA